MGIARIVDPTFEAVALSEIHQQLRLSCDDEDFLLMGYIKAAREFIEGQIDHVLCESTFKLTLDRFPCGEDGIILPKYPVQEVTSVEYVDDLGVEQEIDVANLIVDTTAPGRITPIYGEVWPVTRLEMDAVRVKFTAGYPSVADVPATAKHVIRMLVSHWYENREAVTEARLMQTPMAVEALMRTLNKVPGYIGQSMVTPSRLGRVRYESW